MPLSLKETPLNWRSLRAPKIQRYVLIGLCALATALALSLTLLTSSSPQSGQAPLSADAFVDEVGIVAHFSYTDTPYVQNWGLADKSQDIRSLFAALGIRHLRDRIPNPTLQPEIAYARPRLAGLYRDFGVKMIVGTDIRTNRVLDVNKLGPYLDGYANGVITVDGQRIPEREFIEAIEGPNEYDEHNTPAQRDPNWVRNLRTYQQQVFQRVKKNPLLARLPVVMPSLVYTKYCTDVLGSLESSIDIGNLHPYANFPYFHQPTKTLGWHLENGRRCYGQKPVWVTESGYHSGTNGIHDRTIAKYTSRLLAEYALQPQFQRTYIYSLVDTLPQNGSLWGLIRGERTGRKVNGLDQFRLIPKPSYYAVKNLLDLLRESVWVPSERRWSTPAVSLRSVPLTFQGKLDTTHFLLLQKSRGDYFLLLWQEVESFNPKAGNFTPIDDEITLSLPRDYRIQSYYRYDAQFNYQKTAVMPATNTLKLQIPDSVAVVHFTPSDWK